MQRKPFRGRVFPQAILRRREPGGLANVLGVLRCGLAVLSLFVAGSGFAQSNGVSREYQLKAAFLFQFAQFVEWPSPAFESPESPMVFVILGEDPFGPILEEIARTERVNGRQLQVQRAANLEELTTVHVLFISRSEAERLPEILGLLANRPILNVSDIRAFAERGGMIEFVIKENRVRYEVNPQAARAANLEISSKVLRLATAIAGQKGKE